MIYPIFSFIFLQSFPILVLHEFLCLNQIQLDIRNDAILWEFTSYNLRALTNNFRVYTI